MEIVKVFTKYDVPPEAICVPHFEEVKASPALEDMTDLGPLCFASLYDVYDITCIELVPVHKEVGLEGVRLITYGEVA